MTSALLRGAALALFAGSTVAAPRAETWNFTVYLDDERVGYHRFTLTESGTDRALRSEARFDVKILMINAYSYAHQADETWRGDCLAGIKASTDDNGDRSSLSGAVRDGGFRLQRDGAALDLPSCVMTFAYWNPLMREQRRLLNPQNGKYQDVRIESRGTDRIPVRGQALAARHYALDAGEFKIDLWYADGERWVALDSRLENGHTLRYRIE